MSNHLNRELFCISWGLQLEKGGGVTIQNQVNVGKMRVSSIIRLYTPSHNSKNFYNT